MKSREKSSFTVTAITSCDAIRSSSKEKLQYDIITFVYNTQMVIIFTILHVFI